MYRTQHREHEHDAEWCPDCRCRIYHALEAWHAPPPPKGALERFCHYASVALGLVGVGMLLGMFLGCGGRTGVDDDKEVVSECRDYLDALDRCMNPSGAGTRTANARQEFAVSANDDAARERLAAKCRAASQQISRACR